MEPAGGKGGRTAGGLIIHGGVPLLGREVDPHDDQRLAMSLAVIGLRVPEMVIKDKTCEDKGVKSTINCC